MSPSHIMLYFNSIKQLLSTDKTLKNLKREGKVKLTPEEMEIYAKQLQSQTGKSATTTN